MKPQPELLPAYNCAFRLLQLMVRYPQAVVKYSEIYGNEFFKSYTEMVEDIQSGTADPASVVEKLERITDDFILLVNSGTGVN